MVMLPKPSNIPSNVNIPLSKESLMGDAPCENIFIDNSWASCTQPYFLSTHIGKDRRASWDPSSLSEFHSPAASTSSSSGDSSNSAFDIATPEDRSWSEPPLSHGSIPPFPFRQNLTPSGHPDWGTAPTPPNRQRVYSRPKRVVQDPLRHQEGEHSQSLVVQGDQQQCFRSTRMTDLQEPLMAIQTPRGREGATNNHSAPNENEVDFLLALIQSKGDDERLVRHSAHTSVACMDFTLTNDIPVLFPQEQTGFSHLDSLSQGWPMSL